jgi:eukaryotic-like serine/threonine-protein kinase
MPISFSLEELLLRWQELHAQGRDVPAEELCPDQPELAAGLAAQIRAHQEGKPTPVGGLAAAHVDTGREDGSGDQPPTGEHLDTGPEGTPPVQPPAALSRGRYEILGELGRGGFGAVYRARDGRTGQVVALKTMRRQDVRALELFKGEFRYLQGVSHPNLVQLYELESDGQDWLLTMELVEGVDFLTYVRPGGDHSGVEPTPTAGEGEGVPKPVHHSPLHLGRLREALGQLAEGIAALHAHRLLHRDLKPQNVRVSPEGRVVVLDFGLATNLGPTDEHLHTDQALLGTFAYMAPEQAQSPPVSSPASDWYSAGVMLYQALTGRLPFTGNALQMMQAKQTLDPPAPRDLCPEVPEDLNALCLGLLRRLPQKRPSATEILARQARPPSEPPAGVPVVGEAPLLGRERHLRFLEEAYAASRQQRAVLVSVEGPSGIGKSALVRHFLDGLRRRGVVVLAGRCYEHESVPYKALDPIVDELGRYLLGLPHHEVAARLPRDVGPLMRIFPVLGQVGAVAEAAARSLLSPDPHEVRRRAFAGLRELLARVGDRQPLVLYIDDLQWGDVDSAYLISDLIQPPDPPPLLLLTANRSEDADSPCLRSLREVLGRAGASDRRDLAVAPLSEAETRELVLQLLGTEAETDAAGVARESGGNPFFVTELVQEIQAGTGCTDSVVSGEITLDGLIRARVARLPEGARRLLEVVAVSARPLGEVVAYRAAGDGPDVRPMVARLEAARFLRGIGSAGEVDLETYHDRIREVVVAGLPTDAVREHHGRLGQVLEEMGRGDPEELAGHFEGAGQGEKASGYYGRAGDRAAEMLAFDHAANLYRRSLELSQVSGAEAHAFRVKLGDALANASRGAEAGPVYLTAAEESVGLEKLELLRRASDEFLLSGHTQQGLDIFRPVLERFGLSVPKGKLRAFLGILGGQIWLRLRGLGFRERPADSIPSEELLRIDTCNTLAMRFGMLNVPLSLLFEVRLTRFALRAGEPLRVARALGYNATMTAWPGGIGVSRGEEIWAKAVSLGERLQDMHELACLMLLGGAIAWCGGKWKESLARCEKAEHILAEKQLSTHRHDAKLKHFKLDAWMMLGRWKRIATVLPGYLENTRRRGDRFGTSVMLAHSYLPCLASGQPGQVEEVMRQCWDEWPEEGNVMGGYWSLYGRTEAALCRGGGQEAWELLRQEQAELNRDTFFATVQTLFLLMTHLQARTALAAARTTPADRGLFSRRARLLREAARQARRIERQNMPWSNPLAYLIRAGIANLQAQPEVVSLLAQAEEKLHAADMEMYAAAARRQRGRLLGGDEGRQLVQAADSFMTGQGVKDPACIAAMLVPGFSA